VIPVALGGASTPGNLQLLCAPCNRDKGAALA
jgi:5-methylcytosine-specific restriction endonuclease McrA